MIHMSHNSSPMMFATRTAKSLAVVTVIDTRCGATFEPRFGVTYTCSRHGEHDAHIDCRANVRWTDEPVD